MSEQQGDVGWPPPEGPDDARQVPRPSESTPANPAIVEPPPPPWYQGPPTPTYPAPPPPYPAPQQPQPATPTGFGPLGYEPMRTPLGEGPAWAGGAPLGGVPQRMGAMTVRPAGDPIVRRRRIAGVVTAIGGAALIVGSFADWVRADLLGLGLVNGSGWDNVRGHVADGPVFAALGLLLVVIGVAMAFGMSSRLGRAIGIVAALGAMGGTIYEIVDITSADRATLQAGPWIMLAGSIAGLVGVLAAPGARPAKSGPMVPGAPHPTPPPVVPPSGPPLLQ